MMRLLATTLVLLASAALVALGVKSFYHGTARTRPVVLPFEMFWCASDADCSVTDRIGCCSCSEGGGQAAVTRWRRDNLRRFLKRACAAEQVCVQVDLCRTDVQARCKHRRCQLVFVGQERAGEQVP